MCLSPINLYFIEDRAGGLLAESWLHDGPSAGPYRFYGRFIVYTILVHARFLRLSKRLITSTMRHLAHSLSLGILGNLLLHWKTANRKQATPGGHKKDIREGSICKQRATTGTNNCQRAHMVGYQEISGVLSCNTCIALVVMKPRNLPTVGIDHWGVRRLVVGHMAVRLSSGKKGRRSSTP
ncbi:hypothetical protein AVEN_138241-1 [Araneus ventricosus]|uniref:Uncharacterized protein n=1 Tax=Araneus ventricosus TaxID=182803 RepID=A0A4Y2IRB1_ARAVE|nr:hypothetical protein AVEN_138241-1 [Araneus ventricosus]